MYAMLLRFSSYLPVLILKSQRLKFSQTNNFSQINKFFVTSVGESMYVIIIKVMFFLIICSLKVLNSINESLKQAVSNEETDVSVISLISLVESIAET